MLLIIVITFISTSMFFEQSKSADALHLLNTKPGSGERPDGWTPLTFRKVDRHTEYEFLEDKGKTVIQARSDRSASGLVYSLDLDPKTYATLSWCWKIAHVISKGNGTKKSGDDYAARIYVTFKFDPKKASFWEKTQFKTYKTFFGEYPPKGALNYVWANRLEKGSAVPNPFTERAHMIAIESGSEKTGQWVCEKRNLYEDYLTYFGEEPTNISGIAVMTDTDNTGETATAAYSDLVLQ